MNSHEHDIGANGHDLRARDIIAQAAQLRCGVAVYTGACGVGPRHIDALRAALHARGLDLASEGPFWWRVTELQPVTMFARRTGCQACGYLEIWCGRCRRCGSRP